MRTRLRLDILRQPDDETCGPTSLHALYRYYGDEQPLEKVIEETVMLPTGGTLAALLACHALRRGYSATIYTYNLRLFDPTWFALPGVEHLKAKLVEQMEAKRGNERLETATRSYLEFFGLGGQLRFQELTRSLIRRYLEKERPILTGLSATYLYGCAREVPETNDYDDVRGYPSGHFVVIAGCDRRGERALVADPLGDNPAFDDHIYEVGMERLIGAIMLGVLTYDANLLVIEPRDGAGKGRLA